MDWREQMLAGSFRGVAFQVESHEHLLGRRALLHEYPLRDDPYAEDMGRKGRTFKLELYVIGPNYMAGRDELRKALEAAGPGTLVHPYLGTHQAQVLGEATLRESLREGGMARFSVTFVEPGQREMPEAVSNTAHTVTKRAEKAKRSILEDALSKIDISGPEFVRLKIVDQVTGIVGNLTSAVSSVSSSGIGLWVRQGQTLLSALTALVGSPESLLNSLMSLFTGLGEDVDDATAYAAGLAYATSQQNSTTELGSLWSTAQQSKAQTNAQAIADFTERAALITASSAASSMEFESAGEALTTRENLAAALDDASMEAPDAVYADIVDLRSAVVTDLGTRAAQLPSLSTYTPQTTLPALVVAHKLFGDATRAEEIVSRNKAVRHPGAVPGGTALEVLVDA